MLVAAVAVALAGTATAISMRDTGRTSSSKDGPLIRSRGTDSGTMALHPGVAGLFTPFSAHPTEDIVLDGADAVSVDPHGTVQMVRVTFVGAPGRSAAGRVLIGGNPGQQCITWPPAGLGPTYPVEGLQVPARQKIAFTLYLTADQPGDWTAHGLVIRYHSIATGRSYTLRDNQVDNTVQMRTKENWRTERNRCTPDLYALWTKPFRL